MNIETNTLLDTSFKREVYQGLTSYPKALASKFIYDEKGDQLFRDIMEMPSYYLTRSEFNILSQHTHEIAQLFQDERTGFDLIELGAGDGKKTKILLKYLVENEIDVTYKPIDISQNAIHLLTKDLENYLPHLQVDAEKGEYFEVLDRLKQYDTRKKVIIVLGSNIGNLLHPKAIRFLTKLKDAMSQDDLLFMGFDQKKDPQIVLDAYNDPEGITAAFNKNLLYRINRELDADFEVDAFKHWETYNPETGTAQSFLVAQKPMNVQINKLALSISFEAWETIHTEISQKYDDRVVNWLAQESGLSVLKSFEDEKAYYKNYVFQRTPNTP
ncbi:MAG: L-histidine N(alpha)-methyltransferase [Flavobacteriaceae bacterium]|nr:L-histidine N(alpha)-methyltransferase [Flavobacteriaceae bacterium]